MWAQYSTKVLYWINLPSATHITSILLILVSVFYTAVYSQPSTVNTLQKHVMCDLFAHRIIKVVTSHRNLNSLLCDHTIMLLSVSKCVIMTCINLMECLQYTVIITAKQPGRNGGFATVITNSWCRQQTPSLNLVLYLHSQHTVSTAKEGSCYTHPYSTTTDSAGSWEGILQCWLQVCQYVYAMSNYTQYMKSPPPHPPYTPCTPHCPVFQMQSLVQLRTLLLQRIYSTMKVNKVLLYLVILHIRS